MSPTTALAAPRKVRSVFREFGRDSKAGHFTWQADGGGCAGIMSFIREELVILLRA